MHAIHTIHMHNTCIHAPQGRNECRSQPPQSTTQNYNKNTPLLTSQDHDNRDQPSHITAQPILTHTHTQRTHHNTTEKKDRSCKHHDMRHKVHQRASIGVRASAPIQQKTGKKRGRGRGKPCLQLRKRDKCTHNGSSERDGWAFHQHLPREKQREGLSQSRRDTKTMGQRHDWDTIWTHCRAGGRLTSWLCWTSVHTHTRSLSFSFTQSCVCMCGPIYVCMWGSIWI